MKYGISSRDYLRRAKWRLAERRKQSLFYAAFELRCGIEARLQEYLEGWEQISKKKKGDWKISALGRTTDKEFHNLEKILQWIIRDDSGKFIATLYYTPVTKRLRTSGEKLSGYLHSMKDYKRLTKEFWIQFRLELVDIVKQLEIANFGTLKGPLLINKKTGQMQMVTEAKTKYDKSTKYLLKFLKDKKTFRAEVKYLDSLP